MPDRVVVACHEDYAPWNWHDLGADLSAAPLLARDIGHLIDRRKLAGVKVKLAQLDALLDGFRPLMPDP